MQYTKNNRNRKKFPSPYTNASPDAWKYGWRMKNWTRYRSRFHGIARGHGGNHSRRVEPFSFGGRMAQTRGQTESVRVIGIVRHATMTVPKKLATWNWVIGSHGYFKHENVFFSLWRSAPVFCTLRARARASRALAARSLIEKFFARWIPFLRTSRAEQVSFFFLLFLFFLPI